MTIREVLAGAPLRSGVPESVGGAEALGLEYDSRRTGAGFLFFAFAGSKVDGRQFALQAVERGALAVVSELPALDGFPAPWIEVTHGRRALALAARNFYGAPDTRLGVTGITGTNGKTTTTFLTDAVLRHSGKRTALVGTIEYRMADQIRPAVNTTPESLDLYRMFAELESLGGTHATMEVSSHALALGRVYGISFHSAVFTNFTRDHLDFHHTMDRYFAAKSLLFQPECGTPPRWAVINADDPMGYHIPAAAGAEVLRYGFSAGASVRAVEMQSSFNGLQLTVEHAGARVSLSSPLVGKINAYNILAASSTALTYGLEWPQIAAGVAACHSVPGRFERIDEGQPFLVIVDYAHTDDALRNAIAAARDLHPKRVITLFGCGGDRDRSKRPLMGAAAAQSSDFVVLTSDNPRSEDPLAIMNDVLVGLRRYDTPHVAEPNREAAIRDAIVEAQPGDLVILAGKGHETYQVLKDRTIAFDDRDTAKKVLRGLGYGKSS